MNVDYAVSFEFALRPPLSLKGTIAASTAATCASRATRLAQKALRPVGWTSIVCTLERASDGTEVAL